MKVNSLQDLEVVLQNNAPDYKGELPDYQQEGSKQNGRKYVDYLKEEFTPYQNILYKRALYGLNYFDKKELKKMHWEKRRRIKRVHKRAQSSINLFKQERVNALCNLIFENYFPDQEVARVILSPQEHSVDPEFLSTLELKSLGITKAHVVERFVNEGILPKDFYEVKQAV